MTALPLPCLSLHHRFNVMSLQLGPLGGACAPQHSRLLGPLRAFDRPTKEEEHRLLFPAQPLPSWAPGAGTGAGSFPLCLHIVPLPAQLLRARCACAWPLAALAVASAYAKYSFQELFSLAGGPLLPYYVQSGGQHTGGEAERPAT